MRQTHSHKRPIKEAGLQFFLKKEGSWALAKDREIEAASESVQSLNDSLNHVAVKIVA